MLVKTCINIIPVQMPVLIQLHRSKHIQIKYKENQISFTGTTFNMMLDVVLLKLRPYLDCEHGMVQILGSLVIQLTTLDHFWVRCLVSVHAHSFEMSVNSKGERQCAWKPDCPNLCSGALNWTHKIILAWERIVFVCA